MGSGSNGKIPKHKRPAIGEKWKVKNTTKILGKEDGGKIVIDEAYSNHDIIEHDRKSI